MAGKLIRCMSLEDEFNESLEEARPFIREFCRKYGVRLVEVRLAMENMDLEPAYIFSDNLGHYTLDGIRESLGPEELEG
ncbi:MAG: hypothetical protein ABIB71_06735 [Candidatus Woesearchaeota archaeon]